MREMIAKCGLVALAITASVQPAQACWNEGTRDAATVAKFNMMLMVTALRCRKGADNFLPQYNGFVQRHNAVLGSQHGLIKAQFAQTMGAKGAENAFDRLTIGYANGYGLGHSQMGCRELKQLAGELSDNSLSAASLLLVAERSVGRAEIPVQVCSIATIAGK